MMRGRGCAIKFFFRHFERHTYLSCLISSHASLPKAQKRRRLGFSRVVLPKPHDGILKDAGVIPLKEFRCLENPSGQFGESSWAFVSAAREIYVAQGMCCRANKSNCAHISISPCSLSKGGKSGRHGLIHSTPKHPRLSNIGVQLFEYAYLWVFHAVRGADRGLQNRRHELIPARQLPTVLQRSSLPSVGADAIKISEEDCHFSPYREEGVSRLTRA